MHFDELTLHKQLKTAMAHLDYTELTEVQEKVIPYALIGKDLAVASKTGSGKTLAYLLPLIHQLLTRKVLSPVGPRAIILAPTRELAKQVYAQLRFLLAGSRLKGLLILGGENFNDQIKQLTRQPQIIVATPGRLINHLHDRSLQISGTEFLILDEADRMLDLGFADALKQIHAEAGHRLRQTWLFSATLHHQAIEMLSGYILKAPMSIAVGDVMAEHSDIDEVFHLCDNLSHKERILQHLLTTTEFEQAIVFLATREDTGRLADLYNQKQLTSLALSGDMKQQQRNQVLEQFSRGHAKLLFTTDVAARGLDLTNVSLVINFDMPKHAEEYIHRIGRTGRAGNRGKAISLISPKDWNGLSQLLAMQSREVEFTVIPQFEGKFKGVVSQQNRKFNGQGAHPLAEAKAEALHHRNGQKKASRPEKKAGARAKARQTATPWEKDTDGFEPVRRRKPDPANQPEPFDDIEEDIDLTAE